MIEFELNSKIELVDENEDKVYGTIYDYNDGRLYVSTSVNEKELTLLRVNDCVTGIIFDDLKGKSFDGVVTERKFKGMLIYEISNLRNFGIIQRRQDVRVEVTVPVYYTDNRKILKLDKEKLYDSIDHIKNISKEGTALDLSAGGIKLATKEKFDDNQEIILLIYIDKEPIVARARILYKGVNKNPSTRIYNYGVKFLDISETERETIISYLFVLMRKNRAR